LISLIAPKTLIPLIAANALRAYTCAALGALRPLNSRQTLDAQALKTPETLCAGRALNALRALIPGAAAGTLWTL